MLLPTQLAQISLLTAVTAYPKHFPETSNGLLFRTENIYRSERRQTNDEARQYKEGYDLLTAITIESELVSVYNVWPRVAFTYIFGSEQS